MNPKFLSRIKDLWTPVVLLALPIGVAVVSWDLPAVASWTLLSLVAGGAGFLGIGLISLLARGEWSDTAPHKPMALTDKEWQLVKWHREADEIKKRQEP